MENLLMGNPEANTNMPKVGDLRRQSSYIWIIAAATALLHLSAISRYDFFRNELYFIVCGRHPAFGYVDQPPLIPLLAAATQLFGDHLWLLRLPAVLAAVALVFLTAAFARLFSQRTPVVIAAALSAAISPGIAALSSTLTTATFEPLAWTACAYCLTRFVLRADRKALLWAGAVAGLSMEAKYGIVMWIAGLCLGLLLTPQRRVFASRRFWLSSAIASFIALPSLVWQTVHHWPFLALIAYHHATGFDLTGNPLLFEIVQIFAINFLLAPLWVAGVVAPFVFDELKQVRFLSIAFVVATIIDITSGGKDYYLFAAYPTMFAVGAVVLAKLKNWLIACWLAGATVIFLMVAPLVLPVLSPSGLARYIVQTHLRPRPDETAGIGAPLTQVLSDEFGWRELEQQVAAIYRALPDKDRQKAAIFASNYGEAAAIDVYGRKDGLPPAISGGNQYFLWGPHGFNGSVLLVVNGRPEQWSAVCRDFQVAGRFGVPYAMPYERDRPIMICRGPSHDLQSTWPLFRRYE